MGPAVMDTWLVLHGCWLYEDVKKMSVKVVDKGVRLFDTQTFERESGPEIGPTNLALLVW